MSGPPVKGGHLKNSWVQTAEERVQGEHGAEVAGLQERLDEACTRAADAEQQLLTARCEMQELEESVRSVHRALQARHL